jgi:uncharacterized iron-regulated membrane protein
VTQSLPGRVRRLWLNIHLWIGVGLFLVLVPLGISGSLLVWDAGLDRLLHPARFAVTGPAALPVSAYLDAARQGFGERAAATQVRLPERPGGPVIVTGRMAGPTAPGARPRTLTAWVDPGRGTLLGVAETRRELIGTMHALHGNLLLAPQLGRKVVGWLGWAMFISSATGLWLWWPRNGAPPPAQAGGRPGEGGRGNGGGAPLTATALTIDQAARDAQVWAPGARVSTIVLPTRGDEPAWRVQFAADHGTPPKAVKVSDASGQAEPVRAPQPGRQDPVSRTMRDLHDGGGMGLVWQTLIFIAGIAPTVLGLTGIVMWLRRRALRRRLSHLTAE